MIPIDQLYQSFRGRINEHQGGHARISDFVNWVNEISLKLFSDMVKEYQKTQFLSDELTRFLKTLNASVSANSGTMWDIVKLPSGYENFAAARIIKKGGKSIGCKGALECKDGEATTNVCDEYIDEDELIRLRMDNDKAICEVDVELIDTDRWGAVCSHVRRKVTCANPKITQFSEGFKIYPKGCGTVIVMDFFRLPAKAIYNYTVINPQQENEYFQYNAVGSVNLEWSEKMIPVFLDKLQEKYSIFVQNDSLYQKSKQ